MPIVAELPWLGARSIRWLLLGSCALIVLWRPIHAAIGPIQIDDAQLVIPAVPVVPPAMPVVAQDYGRMGRLFVREGMAVAPGVPLFSLQRDPALDQDLVDRGLARDLAELNDQIRDARRVIDSLTERIVMARSSSKPMLQPQIALARQQLLRRLALWRQGGVSRDLVDESNERYLRLEQELLDSRQDGERLLELEQLLQAQRRQLEGLLQRQAALRRVDLQHRDASHDRPRLQAGEQARLDYAIYRAPGRGVVLRLLKQPGDPVRPHETVAIWQQEQQPPQVEARWKVDGLTQVAPEQRAMVEIPSLRQRYEARLLNSQLAAPGVFQLRFSLDHVPPSEVRRLLALPGEPVRLQMERRALLAL